jgi:transketolase
MAKPLSDQTNLVDIQNLKISANKIRKKLITMHYEAKSAHIGTGLSAIDLLTYLYQRWLKPQDQFILSKGHGASSLYATLHHFGILKDEEIKTYYQDGTLFPAHPAALATPAIPAATGSLGHGLPIAAGMAYSKKYLLKQPDRIACLLSDGECNEGTIWEAALFAGHHELNNLHVIVDANGLQGFGRTEDVLRLEPFQKKWEAFGFEVREINGHNFNEIHEALNFSSTRPICIIARTIKGKGVSFMENTLDWHYLSLKEPQFLQAISELENHES